MYYTIWKYMYDVRCMCSTWLIVLQRIGMLLALPTEFQLKQPYIFNMHISLSPQFSPCPYLSCQGCLLKWDLLVYLYMIYIYIFDQIYMIYSLYLLLYKIFLEYCGPPMSCHHEELQKTIVTRCGWIHTVTKNIISLFTLLILLS